MKVVLKKHSKSNSSGKIDLSLLFVDTDDIVYLKSEEITNGCNETFKGYYISLKNGEKEYIDEREFNRVLTIIGGYNTALNKVIETEYPVFHYIDGPGMFYSGE